MNVLLGNGDGAFQAATGYSSGGWSTDAMAVAVADVNRDGRPDILVKTDVAVCTDRSCSSNAAIGVLLGNGDGTFQGAAVYSAGGQNISSASLAVADVNGDGKPDVIVETGAGVKTGAGTAVLLGNGDGTFQTAAHYRGGSAVAVADINGDGKPDLVVTTDCGANDCAKEGLVSVLLGDGHGKFQVAATYESGGFVTKWVTVSDLNGDGKPDLLVTNLCGTNPDVNCTGSGETMGSVGVLLNKTPRIDTVPPVITVSATPKVLWPPNGGVVPVTISGRIVDPDSGVKANSATYAVSDEYGKVQPEGPVALDRAGNYAVTVLLEASRRGADANGRGYIVTVRASDNAGNNGSAATVVIVPHDQRH